MGDGLNSPALPMVADVTQTNVAQTNAQSQRIFTMLPPVTFRQDRSMSSRRRERSWPAPI
jgi:hypothetical protein